MNNLKNNILNKIEKGEIKKTSKWYFLGKKYTFWTLFILSLISGSISFAILLKNTFDDFGAWYNLKMDENFIFSNILWIWISITILFIISSSLYFKKTKSGFKYSYLYIIFLSIISSLLLGWVFYKVHIGHVVENMFEKHNSKYLNIKHEKKEKILDFLEKHNIDKKEFFRNKNILKKKLEYDSIDKKMINKIEYILKNNNSIKNIDEIKLLLKKIKEKKNDIDEKRLLLLITEYKKE